MIPTRNIALVAAISAFGFTPIADFLLPSPPDAAQLPVITAQAEPEVSEVDTVVANLQSAYEAIDDFSALFTQESTNVALGETTTSEGNVYFLRPGRMLWDYETRRLILDGENIHTVDLEAAQYWSSPIDTSDLPTAMRFLIGEGDLATDFDITLLDESNDERAALDLVPKVPNPDYARVMFIVDRSSWNVVETTIVDPLGNTNTVRFEGLETNLGLEQASFDFVPTPDLVEMVLPE